MNPREANVLLTKATLIDPRLSRPAAERVEQAEAWAAVLADVPLEVALDAVREHYRDETRTVMPADIVAAVPLPVSSSDAGNVTELRLAAERREITQ
ncbi:hypothetical protein ACIPVB_09070 [Microbacterium sp. NPDC090007]|uniref:hypothetical protein n=1 Tax=Microbacterium sp. NPDC090007 TaxID=3364204 RepID=UPI0037FCD685